MKKIIIFFLRWLVGFAYLADGIITLATLGLYHKVSITVWYTGKLAKLRYIFGLHK